VRALSVLHLCAVWLVCRPLPAQADADDKLVDQARVRLAHKTRKLKRQRQAVAEAKKRGKRVGFSCVVDGVAYCVGGGGWWGLYLL
jgi:hypothetical protein